MPADKHDSDYIFTPPTDSLGRVKGQIFKFCNRSISVNIFTEILHAERGTINVKHIKLDFRSKVCVQPPGGAEAKLNFKNMVTFYIKLNGLMDAVAW